MVQQKLKKAYIKDGIRQRLPYPIAPVWMSDPFMEKSVAAVVAAATTAAAAIAFAAAAEQKDEDNQDDEAATIAAKAGIAHGKNLL